MRERVITISKSKYRPEEWNIAKTADLVEVAKSLGYEMTRKGHSYSIKNIDSIMITEHKIWNRFSGKVLNGISGGSQIDFLMAFGNMERDEAIGWLLDFVGYNKTKYKFQSKELKSQYVQMLETEIKKKPFVLPEKAENDKRLYAYLMQKRGISKETIHFFVKNQLIYESLPYHSIIFLGKDKEGVIRFASMRGTYNCNGSDFKGDVAGNDKSFGFNLTNTKSTEISVFEGGIDLISYYELHKELQPLENLLALAMIHDAPLERYLVDYPQIDTINLYLDNDRAGYNGSERIIEKYKSMGYNVRNSLLPKEYKDFNQFLLANNVDGTLFRDWRLSFYEAKKQVTNTTPEIRIPLSSQKIQR